MIPPVAETMVFCAFSTNRRDLITGNREILRFVTGTGKVKRTYVRPLTPLNIPKIKKQNMYGKSPGFYVTILEIGREKQRTYRGIGNRFPEKISKKQK